MIESLNSMYKQMDVDNRLKVRNQLGLFHAYPELVIALIIILMGMFHKNQASQNTDIKMLLIGLSTVMEQIDQTKGH